MSRACRRLLAALAVATALLSPALARGDTTDVFRQDNGFRDVTENWLTSEMAQIGQARADTGSLTEAASVDTGGGGPAPANTVAPYFCGQTGVAANVDMVGGCTAISGSAVQGQTLTVGTGVWTNSPSSIGYQWQACTTTAGQPPTTASCSDIGGATASSYVVQAGDVGKALVPIVTAFNGSTPSTPTTPSGSSCSHGSTPGGSISIVTEQHFDPREPAGCSPISAVAGATSGGMKFCTHAPVTCGFPDPLSGNVGVPHGTSLTTVSSLTCSSGTTNAVYVTGSVSVSGTCTITNSRLGPISANSCTSCTFDHNDIAGDYTGESSATTGTGLVPNISSTCTYTLNGTGSDVALQHSSGTTADLTVSNTYLHCAAESLNGAVGSSDSYIISDECFAQCETNAATTTHNEAIYNYGGQSNLNHIHDVILNPWHQTAGLFTDCGWNGSPISEHVNNNLTATYDNNGAIGVDNEAFGCAGTSTSNQVQGNRFSYVYNAAMNCGYFNGDHMTISGNIRDDTNAAITSDGGC